MASTYVDVKPEVIQWALDQTPEDRLDEKLKKRVQSWISGDAKPSFTQLRDLSRKTYIPFGYFFLDEPPKEDYELLQYRTFNSIGVVKPSRNLLATIAEMERVQGWMTEYREDSEDSPMSFVGSAKDIDDAKSIASMIREYLELSDDWVTKNKSSAEAFNTFRRKLDKCGVVVMMNGIAGNNPHRALDVNEFRAFAIVDDMAPLIFINTTDSNSSKLFSLLHETAHIWLGQSDLFDGNGQVSADICGENVNQIEKICNAVAAELLLPNDIFLNRWNGRKDSSLDRIKAISREFNCSLTVVARRALDNGLISKDEYEKVAQIGRDYYLDLSENKEKKDSGGNYYTTMRSRLSPCLLNALCESIYTGRTTYTEAFRLTNTSGNTFFKVVGGYSDGEINRDIFERVCGNNV